MSTSNPLPFGQRHAITDICVLVKDVTRSIDFYVGKLGFLLNRHEESFAEFTGAGLRLAVWELAHIARHTGISAATAEGPHKACIAVRLSGRAEVDAAYAELTAAGVRFVRPPATHAWDTYSCYFSGPDDELWELYAWSNAAAAARQGDDE